jgi:hypothetical protein
MQFAAEGQGFGVFFSAGRDAYLVRAASMASASAADGHA